jgi:hypothetical protein
MHISDHITHIDNKEDVPFLKNKLFDVNMRLFNSSVGYKGVIEVICNRLQWLALNKFDGYTLPYGISGANAGIPFNIIGIVRNRGEFDAKCIIMINPKIEAYFGEIVETESNCGSIRLLNKIKVKRSSEVLVSYFGMDGKKVTKKFGRDEGSFTIQHEVDHNNGILITDRI